MDPQFLKQVKQDTSKLVDINSVLMKLNDKGHISQMASIFESIFHEEQSFTIQVNNVWNKVSEQFIESEDSLKQNGIMQQQQQLQQEQKLYQNENGQGEVPVQQQQQYEQQPQQVQTQAQQQPQQQQLENQNNEQQNQEVLEDQKKSPNLIQQQQQQQQKRPQHYNNSMQLSTYTTTSVVNNSAINYPNQSHNQQNESWVRKTIKSGNNSIHQVNKSAVDLYEGRRSQALSKTNNISLSQIKQKKSLHLNNTSKMSISSVRSVGSASKLGGTVPFSELSGIHDSHIRSNSPGLNSSFSRAPRDLDKSSQDHSPGPNSYNVDKSHSTIRKSSPNTKFGKSARISWIDERLRYDSSVQTPGAKYDCVKVHTSKPLKK